ncbi:FFD TFG box motifs protein [Schistosoma japonicum]|nr:FFD TFG box motifs protein [Schistosoma japonicum]
MQLSSNHKIIKTEGEKKKKLGNYNTVTTRIMNMPKMNILLNNLKLGIKLSLITNAQYRYEGILAGVNLIEGTLTLQNVQFYGIENRLTHTNTKENVNNKLPTIGTIYDSITFWMTSIRYIWSVEDKTMHRNELNDKSVIKTTVLMNNGRGRRRYYNSWSGAPRNHKNFMKSNIFRNGSTTGNLSTVNSYKSLPNQCIVPQPLTFYSGRGHNGRLLSNLGNYIAIVPPPGNLHRFGSRLTTRNPSLRLVRNPIPPKIGQLGLRGCRRKQSQPMKRVLNSNNREYTAETTIQRRPNNFKALRVRGSRRHITERGLRSNFTIQPDEIDCAKPYDFEMANAELEAELAKINLNTSENYSDTMLEDSVNQGHLGIDQEQTISDGINSKQAISSSTSQEDSRLLTNGNGASVDSSAEGVNSSMHNNMNVCVAGKKSSTQSEGTLAKGEYYAREKCFYDQISRSEGGSRSFNDHQKRRGSLKESNNNHYVINPSTHGQGSGAKNTMVGINSTRTERQLNLETFGPIAGRTSLWRRRKSSSVPRALFVSASA